MLNMEDPLQELRELTESFIQGNQGFLNPDRELELTCVKGRAISVNAYSNIHIAIAETTFYPDTQLPKHAHGEIETIEVLYGELFISILQNGIERVEILKQYSVLIIEPMVLHWSYNKIKTAIIASTMPPSPHFPKTQTDARI